MYFQWSQVLADLNAEHANTTSGMPNFSRGPAVPIEQLIEIIDRMSEAESERAFALASYEFASLCVVVKG
jgi:hypothetical protein